MSCIPTLKLLCSQVIVQDEQKLNKYLNNESLAEDIKTILIQVGEEAKKIEQFVREWKWCATKLEKSQDQITYLTSHYYNDVCLFFPEMSENEFLLDKNQQANEVSTFLKAFKFIRKKRNVKGELFVIDPHTPNRQRLIKLTYSPVLKLSCPKENVAIAKIFFPKKDTQRVKIEVVALETINREVDREGRWNQRDHAGILPFAIYYLNRATLDTKESEPPFTTHHCFKTNQRLNLMKAIKDDEKAKQLMSSVNLDLEILP